MREGEQRELEAAVNVSSENARKLDRLIILLEGSPDSPGILRRINGHEKVLFGEDGDQGIVQRVNIMWRVHIWILCTLSGLTGFVVKDLVTMVFKFK